MGSLFVFIFQTCLVMLALYLVYRLFMSGVNQPTFNRAALLMIYIVSPVIVFVSGLWHSDIPSIQSSVAPSDEFEQLITMASSSTKVSSVWPMIVLYIWIGGIAVTLISIAFSMIRLRIKIKNCEIRRIGQIRLAISSDEKTAPFSTARTIVISRKDVENSCCLILKHESQHIKYWHWIDLMIGYMVAIISWFNPVSWLLISELKEVHEFQVDRRIISMGINRREYQYMLLEKAVGRPVSFFVNHLTQGGIKRRMVMMLNGHASPWSRAIVLLMIPAAAVALVSAESGMMRSFCKTMSETELSDNNNPSESLRVDFNNDEETGEDVNNYQEYLQPEVQEVTTQESKPAYVMERVITDHSNTQRISQPEMTDIQSVETVYEADLMVSEAEENINIEPAAPVTEVSRRTSIYNVRRAGTVATPYYYINGQGYAKLPVDFDKDKIEKIVVRRDIPAYPDGVFYITLKN